MGMEGEGIGHLALLGVKTRPPDHISEQDPRG